MPENMHAERGQPENEAPFMGCNPDAAEAQTEQPELQPGDEERNCQQSHDRREQSHRPFRWPSTAIGGRARVVLDESITCARRLEKKRWDQEESKQEVLRQQLLDPE